MDRKTAIEKLTASVGELGGWFEEGMRWKELLEASAPDYHPYLEAIREAIVRDNIRISVIEHQQTSNGATKSAMKYARSYS
jgi:hypothetical protein